MTDQLVMSPVLTTQLLRRKNTPIETALSSYAASFAPAVQLTVEWYKAQSEEELVNLWRGEL